MKNNLFKILVAGLMIAGTASCQKDLDRLPTNDITSLVAYSTPAGYKQALAKVYGSYALTGNTGPSGSPDVQGLDEGSNADFLRVYWNLQELTTDEAICAWGDPGVPDLHNMNWTSNNPFILGLYNRCIFQITVANEFIRESQDSKLAARGITGADADNIRHYREEARFLRAFQYANLMDLFGNPPFVDETTPIGSYLPKQMARKDVFNYVESELKAIEGSMVAPRQNEYGRADQAAVWALLARIYLNAQVYTGTQRYTDAVTYSQKVISAGYSLKSRYNQLFLADNDKNNPEVILSINYDGLRTKSFGGVSFLINASFNADMDKNAFGMNSGGWGGNRSTKNLPLLFSDYSGATDKRAIFMGSKTEIDDPTKFTDGLAVTKFRNVTSAGVPGSNMAESYADTDFPLFRLAEMYLVYAEAVLRGGTGGSTATAVSYINLLRQRAYQGTSGNITAGDLTLDFVLNERGRELYWEGFRRTDLIRYGRFTTDSYVWPWKGGTKSGKGVDSHFNIFPIPATDLTANPNLTQNPGY